MAKRLVCTICGEIFKVTNAEYKTWLSCTIVPVQCDKCVNPIINEALLLLNCREGEK